MSRRTPPREPLPRLRRADAPVLGRARAPARPASGRSRSSSTASARSCASTATAAGALRSRPGRDCSAPVPRTRRRRRPRSAGHRVILDGELVHLAADGRPDFGLLRRRLSAHGTAAAEHASVRHPATLIVFDVLHLDGYAVRALPYARAPRAAARARRRRPGPAARAVVDRAARRRPRGHARARTRGRRLQAPGLPLPARAALERVAQAQAPPRRDARRQRLDARRPRARHLLPHPARARRSRPVRRHRPARARRRRTRTPARRARPSSRPRRRAAAASGPCSPACRSSSARTASPAARCATRSSAR